MITRSGKVKVATEWAKKLDARSHFFSRQPLLDTTTSDELANLLADWQALEGQWRYMPLDVRLLALAFAATY